MYSEVMILLLMKKMNMRYLLIIVREMLTQIMILR